MDRKILTTQSGSAIGIVVSSLGFLVTILVDLVSQLVIEVCPEKVIQPAIWICLFVLILFVASYLTQLHLQRPHETEQKSLPLEVLKEPGLVEGVDYNHLFRLLAQGRWKEADLETWRVLCEAAGKTEWSGLTVDEIRSISVEHLNVIDRLWRSHSGGRFGFRVQKRLLQDMGDNLDRFGDRIGWRENSYWKLYETLQFDLEAPEGHLPVGGPMGIVKAWLGPVRAFQYRKEEIRTAAKLGFDILASRDRMKRIEELVRTIEGEVGRKLAHLGLMLQESNFIGLRWAMLRNVLVDRLDDRPLATNPDEVRETIRVS